MIGEGGVKERKHELGVAGRGADGDVCLTHVCVRRIKKRSEYLCVCGRMSPFLHIRHSMQPRTLDFQQRGEGRAIDI